MDVAPPPEGVDDTLSLPRDLTEEGVAPFCGPPDVSGVGSDLKLVMELEVNFTEIGKKAWLFAKLQPGRARKRMNAT